MGLSDELDRDVESIRPPEWGRVVPSRSAVAWQVVDPDGKPVQPIQRFLRDFVARGNRPGSVRSYAYALQRWWRFLLEIEVGWDKVTSAEVRDFVLWLKAVDKPRRVPRTKSAATAGRINPITRKQYPSDRYEARTIRLFLADGFDPKHGSDVDDTDAAHFHVVAGDLGAGAHDFPAIHQRDLRHIIGHETVAAFDQRQHALALADAALAANDDADA